MNKLQKALESVKLATHNEIKNKFEDAIDDYTRAVKQFRSVLISETEETDNFKSKVKCEIEFCLKQMEKLEQKKEKVSMSKEHVVIHICEESDDDDDDNDNDNDDDEKETEIKFYLKYMNKMEREIELLKKNIDSQTDNDHEDDTKIRNRIKATILTVRPNIKFDDVCGLEMVKDDLRQTILLPLKQPQVFSLTKPYKSFLFFGVSIV